MIGGFGGSMMNTGYPRINLYHIFLHISICLVDIYIYVCAKKIKCVHVRMQNVSGGRPAVYFLNE